MKVPGVFLIEGILLQQIKLCEQEDFIMKKRLPRILILLLAIAAVAVLFRHFSDQKGKMKLRDPDTLHLYITNGATIARYEKEYPERSIGSAFHAVEITDRDLLDAFSAWFNGLPNAVISEKRSVHLGGWPLEFFVYTDSSFYLLGIQPVSDGTYTITVGTEDWGGKLVLTEDKMKPIWELFSTYSSGEYYLIKDLHERHRP